MTLRVHAPGVASWERREEIYFEGGGRRSCNQAGSGSESASSGTSRTKERADSQAKVASHGSEKGRQLRATQPQPFCEDALGASNQDLSRAIDSAHHVGLVAVVDETDFLKCQAVQYMQPQDVS